MMKKILLALRRALQLLARESKDWELRGLMLFGAGIILIGTLAYMQLERWDFWQALYFCVATLTTVGYGDLHPTSDLSRAFTTLYMLIGIGFILGFLNVAARHATLSFTSRMTKRIDAETKLQEK